MCSMDKCLKEKIKPFVRNEDQNMVSSNCTDACKKKQLSKSTSVNTNPRVGGFFCFGLDKETQHILINYSSMKIIGLSSRLFSKLDYPCFVEKKIKIKFKGCTRNEAKRVFSQYRHYYSFEGESFFSTMKNIFENLNHFVDTLKFFSNSLPDVKKLQRVGLSFVKIFKLICVNFKKKMDVELLIDFLLEFYTLSLDLPLFNGEGLGSFSLAALSTFLPPKLFEIIKRVQIFTNLKLCDDVNIIFKVITGILDFVEATISLANFPGKNYFDRALVKFRAFVEVPLFAEMDRFITTFDNDKKVMSDELFRQRIKEIIMKVEKSETLLDMIKKSKKFENIYQRFTRLHKSVISYEKNSRVEPVCFVLEGRPGVFKSVIMVKLLKVLQEPVYFHKVNMSGDGKDFYDMYNDEEIFAMDDVGQNSVDQWRTIINMVSPTKLPLNCASEKLKDTKYFNSNTLLLTTNNCMNIHGLTPRDGISDIKALWRRTNIFDFYNVKREQGDLYGTLNFRYYNEKEKGFVCDFPPDVRDYLRLNNITLSSSYQLMGDNDGYKSVLAWMYMIISIFRQVRKDQYRNNELTTQDVCDIRQIAINSGLPNFEGESATIDFLDYFKIFLEEFIIEPILDLKEIFSKYLVKCSENFKKDTLYNHIKNFFYEYRLEFTMALYVSFVNVTAGLLYQFIYGGNEVMEFSGEVDSLLSTNHHPLVETISKQVFSCMVNNGHHTVYTSVFFSGRFGITTSHAVLPEGNYLTVYKDIERNHILIDHVPIIIEFNDFANDLCIFSLPANFPAPFKNLSHCFKPNIKIISYLVYQKRVLDIVPILSSDNKVSIPYKTIVYGKEINNTIQENRILYGVHGKGMCGSPIVTIDGGIRGIHVAGSQSSNVGMSIIWPENIRNVIYDKLNGRQLLLECDVSTKIVDNFSGIKLCENYNVFTPKNTNYVPTCFASAIEHSRVPANLRKYGNHTIKDVSKKSFHPIKHVDEEEMHFGKQVLDMIIPNFGDISMKEVICGNDWLSGVNKDSSNGLFHPKTKKECIDFINGELLVEYQGEYDKFLTKLRSGLLTPADLCWSECLKDELRAKGKDPRSFRVSQLNLQIISKMMFGDLVSQLMQHRSFNGISIGINPHKHFKEIFNNIHSKRVWAGDIGSWDGSMLTQVQLAIIDIMRKKYKGAHHDIFDAVTSCLPFAIVAINDDVYMTNHSIASGHFLTAIMNSLVNKFYSAMWFYRNTKDLGLKSRDFFDKLVDYAYGDDKLNALNDESLGDRLNALTMQEFFNSIGMSFTDSLKKPIIAPFQSINEITFLKRYFRYHSKLKQIVAPLEFDSIWSSICYVDVTKEGSCIVTGKQIGRAHV